MLSGSGVLRTLVFVRGASRRVNSCNWLAVELSTYCSSACSTFSAGSGWIFRRCGRNTEGACSGSDTTVSNHSDKLIRSFFPRPFWLRSYDHSIASIMSGSVSPCFDIAWYRVNFYSLLDRSCFICSNCCVRMSIVESALLAFSNWL